MPRGKAMRNPNGYGTVVKLSGNRRRPYEVRVNTRMDERNYPVYDVLGRFAERTEAMIALAKYNEDPYDLKLNNLTFEDVYKKWYEHKYEKGKKKYSESTRQCTRSAFSKCASLHKMKFKDIRTLHMQEILDDYSLSHAYMEHIKSLFNQLYQYALEYDIVQKDYSAFAKITKEDDDTPGVPFSREELSALWQHKDLPFVDSVLIFIYTGWRISELLPMKREQIDLDARTMTGGVKTAAGKNRIVPIHPAIYDMIARRMADGYPVLFGLDGKPVKSQGEYRRCFAQALKDAGIQTIHTPHDCRHTFATLLNNAGANPVSVKRLMGHTSGNDVTEKVYTHKDIDELRKAVELIPAPDAT